MVRIGAFLVGVFFTGWLIVSFGVGLVAYVNEPAQETAEHAFHLKPKPLSLSSDGPLGKFDRQQLQRGFQVYKEVCAACHSMRLVSFRNFAELGYSEDEVKAIAANWPIQTPSIDPATGEATTRPSLASDPIPMPHANETAARAANGNALPPDLSLITKARSGGAPYIYSLLTGYQEPPAELAQRFPDSMPGPGLNYNPYFANLNIAMANPIGGDGIVTYADGTEATRDQMAKDVSAFLVWTAEPTLEKRNQTGWAVLIFLIIATGLAFMSYKSIWAGKKH
ncbi:cytochrome c1 [Blastomonas sp.]|uniref:cytochrome c1 n=1 Tax=Blastomonas sp. TaxID=1909299 RepID=UPI0035939497